MSIRRWAFPQAPLARVARVRAAIYAIVILDVLFFVTDPIDHGDVPAALYRELPVRALLHLPQPSPTYGWVLLFVILVSAAVAASGRWPRLAGWVCAVAMLDWVSNGMSYGKVDHDHFALVVALFVLPTVGRAGWFEGRGTEAAGWALRMIQLAVVATYFLSAIAKIREGGWLWGSSATLIWALSRRGDVQPAQWLSMQPMLTNVMQWTVFVAELLSPVMLWLRGRALLAAVGFWIIFHASTYVLLTIHFLPTAICLLAFLPLERIGRRGAPVSSAEPGGAGAGEPVASAKGSRRRAAARLRIQS
ncbi:MAG TPA: HTTM domain-containing protein [Intrasporangium sp.]|jgi:hypothetical protein|uniref:HTTM domain-containing protein n=1 Tax=Intrasporangium sp. TaxID=1925024 RepID=UPI002F92FD81